MEYIAYAFRVICNKYVTGHVQIDNNAATIPWQPISTQKGQHSAISSRSGDLFPSVA